MKITVFIPSIPRSFGNLKNIIDVYNNGSVVPDEIIINASNVDDSHKGVLESLIHDNVTVYMHSDLMCAGMNRQMAKEYASGDIIIYQDDDDLPSKYRVETCEKIFNDNDILVLNHNYGIVGDTDINPDNIVKISSQDLYDTYFPNGDMKECKNITTGYGSHFGINITAGAVCIKKEVLDTIKWKTKKDVTLWAEDYEFCMEALFTLNKSMLIDSQIYFIGR